MAGTRKDTTQAIMDGVLRFLAGGGFLTTALVATNAIQLFDKPLTRLLNNLDKRAAERELRRVIHYMKRRGLIQYDANDYQHGMVLTAEGKKRLKSRELETLSIPRPRQWDKQWRLVFFDIPETLKTRRNMLSSRLRIIGMQPLQKSIWIHPFPCRAEIEAITELLGVRRYVTYVEISNIDGDKQLRNRFNRTLSSSP